MISASTARRFITSLGLVILMAMTLPGQSSTGSISGVVRDNNGAPIPDARVTITNPATGVSRAVTTNSDGLFVATQLLPASYTIIIEKEGFKKVEKSDVVLTAAALLSAGEFILDVGEVSDTITVTADAGQLQVQSESGERSGLLSSTQIRDLALNGRNMLSLVGITPGIVSTVNGQVSGPGGLGSISINGTRMNQHELTVDGSSNVDTGSNGTMHTTINPDAIAEVKVLTSNYQAEFGRAGGGFIQFVTKSGTREFHGSGRLFHRHEGLNANNFFRNAEGRNADGTEKQGRPLYRYNYFGFDIGGPVYLPRAVFGPLGGWNKNRDKLFFFWSEEFYRQLVPGFARNIRVPTALERQGDFSQTLDGNGDRVFISDPSKVDAAGARLPCTAANTVADPGGCFLHNGQLHVIPPDSFFSNGQAILNIYPAPTVTGNNQFNYTSSDSNPYPRREDIIRIDYTLSEKTNISGRFIRNKDEQLLPYGTFASNLNFPLSRIVFPQPGRNGVLSITHTFSPTLTNEFIFGPSMNRLTLAAEDEKATRAANNLTFPLLFPSVNGDDYIPNFNYGGIANNTFPNTGFGGLPFRNVNHTFNFIDNVSKVSGAHMIKAGIYLQRSRKDQTSFGFINSNIFFNSDAANPLNTGHPFANALLGIYNSYSQADNFLTGLYRYWNIEGYLQDNWKVSRRFTLDYGMRISWYEPQYDARLQTGVFNPDLYNPAKAVSLYIPILVDGQRRAIDPRNVPATLTNDNTQPASFIGLIVPNSGEIANGIGRTNQGYPKGGFNDRGVHWGPRLGFAFDMLGNGKTILRGGFGISYDRLQGNEAFNMIATPPQVLTPTLFFGKLADLSKGGGALAPGAVVGYAKDGKLPTVYSYSLGIQRELPFNTVVDISYVATLSRHLNQARNINAIPYGTTFTRAAQDPTRFAGGVVLDEEPNLPAAYSQQGLKYSGALALPRDFLRPFPGYGDIVYREFVGTGNYHSLQLSANRRFSRGLHFGLAYTWSKALVTANADSNFTNPYNTRLYDYQLANFDRRHVMAINYVWDLPKPGRLLGNHWLAKSVFDNWQISGISSFSSGSPFELNVGIADINVAQRITGSYTEIARFILKGDPAKGPNGMLINPDAFNIPAIGSVGLGERTYLTNPGINNHDISFFKNFPFSGEGKRYLQLRFELFNAFNHTQFNGINSGTNLAVRNADGSFTAGGAIFDNYGQVIISNNVRGQRASDAAQPLGRFFGEYNSARDARIIQLGIKLYF